MLLIWKKHKLFPALLKAKFNNKPKERGSGNGYEEDEPEAGSEEGQSCKEVEVRVMGASRAMDMDNTGNRAS